MKKLAILALTLAAVASAQALDVLPPPYQVRERVEGELRIWGNPEMLPLLERWEKAFQKSHPQVRFVNRLDGSDVGMAGLYTGRADIVLLGRSARASEVKAFEWIYRYQPARVEVMGGSLAQPGRSPALVAYVHRDNPVSRLSLAQIDAAFSAERLRGASAAALTWGALSLTGEWAARPVHLYTVDTESGTGRYFREEALMNSRKLNWESLQEFADHVPSHDAGRQALDALAADRDGLAVADGPAPARVRALALQLADGASVEATRESLIARRYPLARGIYAYFNRRPGTSLDAVTSAFLAYVLSQEGQREILPGDAYLPLNMPLAQEGRDSLR